MSKNAPSGGWSWEQIQARQDQLLASDDWDDWEELDAIAQLAESYSLFTLATVQGPISIKVAASHQFGPYIVHASFCDETWTVTHAGSGCALQKSLPLHDAVALARALQELVPTTDGDSLGQPGPQTRKQLWAAMGQLCPVEDRLHEVWRELEGL